MRSFTHYDAIECSPVEASEARLQRQIDRAIGQALINPDYRGRLLAEPVIALNGMGCTPKQHLDLRGIRASSLREFANKARAVFWPTVSADWIAQRPSMAAVG